MLKLLYTGELMKKASNFLDFSSIGSSSSNSFGPKPLGNFYEFYLSGEIRDAEDYIDWFNTIRHADEGDVIKIYINSPGGNLYTAIQFMRVMSESNATIISSVEGACMSAATIIFLCSDSFEVTPHSIFMFHNYSGGTVGKGGEMITQLIHEKKWTENIFNTVYKDFLTDQEINGIIEDKDIWMDGDEVIARMNKMLAQQAKENEEETEEAEEEVKSKPKQKAPAKKKTQNNEENVKTE
jgi:ATP-dependent protease ClpP protease subunit